MAVRGRMAGLAAASGPARRSAAVMAVATDHLETMTTHHARGRQGSPANLELQQQASETDTLIESTLRDMSGEVAATDNSHYRAQLRSPATCCQHWPMRNTPTFGYAI
jgi:hypothetical protein